MRLRETSLAGVLVAETPTTHDGRGAFSRWFCDRELSAMMDTHRIAQINHSLTRIKGTVRGMHYQSPPHAEMKLIRCLRGRVWDVAVDLRRGSPTFGRWHAEELSPERACMLIIPEGCAHGFQVLEADSELLYLHTTHYEKSAEGGIRADDPTIGITWPLAISELSARDVAHPLLDAAFAGIQV